MGGFLDSHRDVIGQYSGESIQNRLDSTMRTSSVNTTIVKTGKVSRKMREKSREKGLSARKLCLVAPEGRVHLPLMAAIPSASRDQQEAFDKVQALLATKTLEELKKLELANKYAQKPCSWPLTSVLQLI